MTPLALERLSLPEPPKLRSFFSRERARTCTTALTASQAFEKSAGQPGFTLAIPELPASLDPAESNVERIFAMLRPFQSRQVKAVAELTSATRIPLDRFMGNFFFYNLPIPTGRRSELTSISRIFS